MYFNITKQEELDFFTKNAKVVVLDFHAEWCGPCKALSPELVRRVKNSSVLTESVVNQSDVKTYDLTATDFTDKVVFLKCDVDASRELASIFKISAMPTIYFYLNGKLHKDFVKGANPDKIMAIVETLFEL